MAGFDPFKGDFGFYGKGLDGYAHYKQSMDEINKRAPRAQRPPQNLVEQDAQPDPKSSENDNSLNDNAEILQKITVDRFENPQEYRRQYKQLKREQYERNAAERPTRRQAKREAELARQRQEAEALAEEERMDKIIKFLNVCLYIGLAIFMVWVLATVLAD